MRYLSVCSGIEAATVAWHPLGWEAAAFSEIEAFPRAVLTHHYPDTPLHGDFTTIGADDYGAIDLLVGGTPCQSFSVAGIRGGLGDDRGNLALEYLRLADRKRPRWLVWENVPGVLSSNGGRDFGAILGGMVELGYSFAYRVLDAQFFGVPQRRRRVFVIGYLGDWRRAAAVLFERHSLSGHPAPRRHSGEGITASPGGIAGTCSSKWAKGTGGPAGDEHYNRIGGWDYENNAHGPDEPTGPLLKGSPTGGGRPLPAIAIQERAVSENIKAGPQGKGYQEDTAYTLEARNKVQAVAFQPRIGRNGRGYAEDVFPALNGSDAGETSDMRPCVAFAQNQRDELRTMDVAGALEPGMKQQTYVAQSAVRRLTPRECERLQGFPDDYTLVPYRGKPAADGPRYKALGNSMAVPVMAWIGERIAKVEAIQSQAVAA